jgi:hypothetical protein
MTLLLIVGYAPPAFSVFRHGTGLSVENFRGSTGSLDIRGR